MRTNPSSSRPSRGRNRRHGACCDRETIPKATRPHMPGYGLPTGSKGLLPWKWAEERLSRSHNYWLTTSRPDARPHSMIVWGIWVEGRFYFSTGAASRKAKNLGLNPHCIVCTEKAAEADRRGRGEHGCRRHASEAPRAVLREEVQALEARPEYGANLPSPPEDDLRLAREDVQGGHTLDLRRLNDPGPPRRQTIDPTSGD